MIYILKEEGKILSYGESAFGVGTNQTQETFEGTLAEYSARFKVASNKQSIQADGEDEAIVTLYSTTSQEVIGVTVNDVLVNVEMTNGQGILPSITAETDGIIVIKPADETTFSAAGEGSLAIVALEVQE